jgi:hypothetical protein
MKYALPASEVRLQWVPTEEALASLRPLAKAVADALPKEPVAPDFGL